MNVRNLEQIQEDDTRRRPARIWALLLASIGGAAIVTAVLMSAKRTGPPATSKDDPLATLVAQSKSSAAVPAEKLDGTQVTFPDLLSDQGTPTTALAAVKDERGNLLKQPEGVLAPGAATNPPPATDRLPIVPLPAGALLAQTPVTAQPKDQLTQMAASASKLDPNAELAPAGAEGGYQIQIASVKVAGDADNFVADLRRRGHRAYRQAAYVPDRGLWHRVRIGPFKTKFDAIKYKERFERTERVSPFVVDPDKVKQAEDIRAAKLAARAKNKGAGRLPTPTEE